MNKNKKNTSICPTHSVSGFYVGDMVKIVNPDGDMENHQIGIINTLPIHPNTWIHVLVRTKTDREHIYSFRSTELLKLNREEAEAEFITNKLFTV